jgi:hypothetical protein
VVVSSAQSAVYLKLQVVRFTRVSARLRDLSISVWPVTCQICHVRHAVLRGEKKTKGMLRMGGGGLKIGVGVKKKILSEPSQQPLCYSELT